MLTSTQIRKYRHLRAQGWPAQLALSFVRHDLQLTELEDDHWIRFEWLDDIDYWNWTDEHERDMIQQGRWEAAGCVAMLPERDIIVGWPTGNETPGPSVWGIVGPFDCSDADYRRDIEIQLAFEAGLLH